MATCACGAGDANCPCMAELAEYEGWGPGGIDPAYEAYMVEREAEYEREQAHGGKEKCPLCKEYAITNSVVNERQDPTNLRTCGNCGATEMFGDWYDKNRKPVEVR